MNNLTIVPGKKNYLKVRFPATVSRYMDMIILLFLYASSIQGQAEVVHFQSFKTDSILGNIYEVKLNPDGPRENIRLLHPRADGTYYIFTPSGLFHWTQHSLTLVEEDAIPIGLDLNASVEDQEGRIWFHLDLYGKNVPVTNLWAFKPKSEPKNIAFNPLNIILLPGEKVHKLHQLKNNTIVFQTNTPRLIIYRNAVDYSSTDLPENSTLLGGGDKTVIIGEYSNKGTKISLFFPKTEQWKKLPLIHEDQPVDFCTDVNGHLMCVGDSDYVLSKLPPDSKTWSHETTPESLFHFHKSPNDGFFQEINGQNIHTLTERGLDYSPLLNEINQWLPMGGGKNYFFAEENNWILTNNGLFFVTLQEKNEFLPVLKGLPEERTSTRGLIEIGNKTLLAGTYSGVYEFNTNSLRRGLIKYKKVDSNPNCPVRYVHGFHMSQFLDSAMFVYYNNIHIGHLKTGECHPFELRSQQIADIWGVAEVDSNHILVGSTTGLFSLNVKTEEVSHFQLFNAETPIDLGGISINRITPGLTVDTYWVSSNKGLFLIKISSDNERPEGVVLETLLPGIPAHAIAMPTEKELLVTTMNKGLIHLRKSNEGWKIIQEFNTSNFLATNRAHSIELDKKGRAWLGTDDGLYQICLDLGIARRFDTEDGVSHNEFNRLASLYLQNGWMVFGGIDGYNFFKPVEFPKPGESQSTGINALKVNFDDPKLIQKVIHSSQESGMFKIPSKANSITPVADLPFSHLVESIFYRKADNQSNWVKALNHRIPLRELKSGAENHLHVLIKLTTGQILLSDKPIVLYKPDGSVVSRNRIVIGAAIVIIILSGIWLFFISKRYRDKEQDTQLASKGEEIAEPDEKPETPPGDNTETKTTLKEKPITSEKISGESESLSLISNSEEAKPEKKLPSDRFKDKKSRIFKEPSEIDEQIDQEFYESVRSIIEKNLSNSDFKVQELATEMGYSKRKLHRLMKDKTGKTPHAILSDTRLERAKSLLMDKPDLTIAEVTYAVGMNKPSYMSKIFKEKYGITIRSFKAEVKRGKTR